MEASGKTNVFKAVLMAFLVGGFLSIIGQLFQELIVLGFGPGFPMTMPLTLLCMGLFTLVTFPCGLYQRLMKIGGFGAIMPFSGFVAACAMEFSQARAEKGSVASGCRAAAKLVAYVTGTGGLLSLVVAIIVVFAL